MDVFAACLTSGSRVSTSPTGFRERKIAASMCFGGLREAGSSATGVPQFRQVGWWLEVICALAGA
jgi:hypothetical protein